MIPDEYSRLIRHWFWLIGAFAIVGAIVALFLVPTFVDSGSSFDSRATLGIFQNASLSSISTTDSSTTNGATGAVTQDGSVKSDYDPVLAGIHFVDAESLAAYAGTPQFLSALRKALEGQDISLSDAAIKGMLETTPNSPQFRIDLHAKSGSQQVTDAVVTSAATVLMDRAKQEEQGATTEALANLERQRSGLSAQLVELRDTRNQLLEEAISQPGVSGQVRSETLKTLGQASALAAGGSPDLDKQLRDGIANLGRVLGEPELAVTDLELTRIEGQVADVVAREQSLRVNTSDKGPAAVLVPTDTVQIAGGGQMGKKGALVLGGGAGLLIGWLGANVVEKRRPVAGLAISRKQ